MTLTLSHFQAMFIFALAISIAFGFLSRRPALDRAKYIGWSLLLFLLIVLRLGDVSAFEYSYARSGRISRWIAPVTRASRSPIYTFTSVRRPNSGK